MPIKKGKTNTNDTAYTNATFYDVEKMGTLMFNDKYNVFDDNRLTLTFFAKDKKDAETLAINAVCFVNDEDESKTFEYIQNNLQPTKKDGIYTLFGTVKGNLRLSYKKGNKGTYVTLIIEGFEKYEK